MVIIETWIAQVVDMMTNLPLLFTLPAQSKRFSLSNQKDCLLTNKFKTKKIKTALWFSDVCTWQVVLSSQGIVCFSRAVSQASQWLELCFSKVEGKTEVNALTF